jgi:hypothetical protein
MRDTISALKLWPAAFCRRRVVGTESIDFAVLGVAATVGVMLTEVAVGTTVGEIAMTGGELGSTALVGTGLTCGVGMACGGCVAAGVGIGVDVGVGVGLGVGKI